MPLIQGQDGNQTFHIWSRLRGNGDHTPDPDSESFKTRLRDTLRFGDLRELSVPLLSGTGSRFGTGVGEEQRAGQSAVARPASRPAGCSRTVRVSSVLCRVQQVNRVSNLRAARARPEDGHCPSDCSRPRGGEAWLPSPFTATHDSAEFGFSPVTSVNQRNRIIQL